MAKVYKLGRVHLIPRVKVEQSGQASNSNLDEYSGTTAGISGIDVDLSSESTFYGLGLDFKINFSSLIFTLGADFGLKSTEAKLVGSRCQASGASSVDSTCTVAESGYTKAKDESSTLLSYNLGVGYKISSFMLIEGFYTMTQDPHFLAYSYTYAAGEGLDIKLAEVDIAQMGLRLTLSF